VLDLALERWLETPVQLPDGSLRGREKGTPQGSVISPLLANLFLHYAFDRWMQRKCPMIRFERYADDVICHCKSKSQAEALLKAIRVRMAECELELNTELLDCFDLEWDQERCGIHNEYRTFLYMNINPIRTRLWCINLST